MQIRHPWLSAVIIPAPLVRMNMTISYRLNAGVKVGTKNEIGPTLIDLLYSIIILCLKLEIQL